MAAANLIARSEAKLDAQSVELQARLDARNAGSATLRRVIGVGFVSLGILMTPLRLESTGPHAQSQPEQPIGSSLQLTGIA